MRTVALLISLTVIACAQDAKQPVEVRAILLAPISAQFSIKGDLVSAKVTDPPAYAGAFLEGEIDSVRKARGNKSSSVQFHVHTLWLPATKISVSAAFVHATNSHGLKDADESSLTLEHGIGKARHTRADIPPVIELSVAGPNLSLAPGSVIVLQTSKD